jgi:hypothetical protein
MTRDQPAVPDIDLPEDLVAFLTAGKSLEYNQSTGAAFAITVLPVSELALEPIEFVPGGCEPFAPDPLAVKIDPGPMLAIRLAVVGARDYDVVRFLVWLPEPQRYGVWDISDRSLRVFRQEVTWERIASSPDRLLNGGTHWEVCVRRDEAYKDENPIGRAVNTVAMVRALKRRRARDWILFNALLFTVVVFGYLRLTSPPPAISPETYERIALGMTADEVHDIVRARPGGYGLTWNPHRKMEQKSDRPEIREDRWGSPDGLLAVGYDVDCRVCRKSLSYSANEPQSHPEHWSWWKRLWNRTIPESGPMVIYTNL